MKFTLRFLLCLLSIGLVHAEEYLAKFDGLLGSPQAKISNCISNAYFFLPYNPTIVEIGGYEGELSHYMAKASPKGRVIVFEPNPRAFERLLQLSNNYSNILPINSAVHSYNGTAKLYLCHGIYADEVSLEPWSSLLPEQDKPSKYFKGPVLEVPCVVLDDWCRQNQIDHIDMLRVDVEGLELPILQSSPEILKTVLVVSTKTHFTAFRKGTTQFPELKKFLESAGFEMLSHWYREGTHGEALFVKKYMYDALFR